jgi:DNA-binding MarR family transcriptional regulator
VSVGLRENIAQWRELLREIARRLNEIGGEVSAELDMPDSQIQTLMYLMDNSEATMGVLGEHTGVSVSRTTSIVDALTKRGFVLRDRDTSDRRVVNVRITKAGEEQARGVRSFIDQRLMTLLEMLDDDDRKKLFELMEKMATNIPVGDKPVPHKGASK